MQPLLNASKAWQTIPDGSLKKWEPSKKHTKNKLSLVTEVDELQTIISYINYWDQVNYWKTLWKLWNGLLCRKK